MSAGEELLNVNELAAALKRCRQYVYWMKVWNFPMPGGTATLSEARQWLLDHPDFKMGKAPPVDGVFV